MGRKKGRRKAKRQRKKQEGGTKDSSSSSIVRTTDELIASASDRSAGRAMVNILTNSTLPKCPLRPNGGKFRSEELGGLALILAETVREAHQQGFSPPVCMLCSNRHCRLRTHGYRSLDDFELPD